VAEHATRLRSLDFIVIFILAAAIVALCLLWASGSSGPNAPVAAGNVSVHFIDVGQTPYLSGRGIRTCSSTAAEGTPGPGSRLI